jgi:hypothetical protein
MNARTLISVIALGAIASGCAITKEVRIQQVGAATPTRTAPISARQCLDDADCTAKVAMVYDTGGARLEVDPEFLVVSPSKRPLLLWTLTDEALAAGYRFDKDYGIVIKNIPAREFECGARAQNKEFACNNKHSGFGVYKYEINLNGPDGALKLDPYIINN